MMKRHGLGRGLAALIPQEEQETTAVREHEAHHSEGEVINIPINMIQKNPDQPRSHFSEAEIQSLSQSIKMHGVLQPLIVTTAETGYTLIAGERRLLAATRAGLPNVPCIIRGGMTDRNRLEIAIIENVQREDLSYLDQAYAYSKLHKEFGMSHDQIAQAVGKMRPSISNIIRLLDLPEQIMDALRNERITYAQARGLLAAKDKDVQQEMFERLLAGKLTRNGIERETRREKINTRKPRGGKKDPELLQYEQVLTRSLATPVRVKKYSEERGGTIEIDYYSNEELSSLVERFSEQKE